MDINCTYDCLYQIEGKCCLTKVPKSFASSRNATALCRPSSPFASNYAYYDGDCPYRTIGAVGSFRSAMMAFT